MGDGFHTIHKITLNSGYSSSLAEPACVGRPPQNLSLFGNRQVDQADNAYQEGTKTHLVKDSHLFFTPLKRTAKIY